HTQKTFSSPSTIGRSFTCYATSIGSLRFHQQCEHWLNKFQKSWGRIKVVAFTCFNCSRQVRQESQLKLQVSRVRQTASSSCMQTECERSAFEGVLNETGIQIGRRKKALPP